MIQMVSRVQTGETDLLVFISSRMDEELASARETAKRTIDAIDVGRPWVFEYTPASSEPADHAYLRKVKEADFVIWLVGSTTTPPVENEVNECLASDGRLLVFKLPAEQRDERTDALLDRVGRIVKWREVAPLSNLDVEIRAAVLDELIRGFRDPSGPIRMRTLWQNRDWSFAHCEVSWRSIGVCNALAKELAQDTAVGDVLGDQPPGLNVVVGPQGSGKTLATHRLFQHAVEVALEDSSKPFPVFLEAVDLRGGFREVIARSCGGSVDPKIQPITVFVDGLDERGATEANSLLRQLETYVLANPKTTVLASIRPLPGLQYNGNVVEMLPLGHRETEELIQRVSGKGLPEILPLLRENSLYQSAKSPLFAVMLGTWLRDNQDMKSVSTYRLVEHMAANAIDEISTDPAIADTLLQRLAVRSITYGARIRPSEVTPRRAEQRLLADSRLVFESETGFDFTLPIFREWYAARAILEGAEVVENLDLKSERWAIPLSIVVHSEHRATAQDAMKRVASTNPAIAGAVLEDDEHVWYRGGSPPSVPSSAVGVGEEIRQAMGLWAEGLGSLFRAIGPTDAKGELASLGIIFDGTRVQTGWYCGSASLDPVVELNRWDSPLNRDVDWRIRRDWPIWESRGIPSTELWAWVITKQYLVRNLKEALEERRLSHVVPQSLWELAWEFGLGSGRSPWRRETRPSISAVLEYIQQLPEDPRTTVYAGGKRYSWAEIEAVRNHLSGLIQDGHVSLHDPWPTADLPRSSSSRTWSPYSDERLLDRAAAVHAAALKIYQAMVECWFQPFSEQMRLYRLLPVRLEGLLTKREIGGVVWPSLSWRPVILPRGQESHVDFDLGEWGDWLPGIEQHFEEQREAFLQLRSGDPDSGVLFHSGTSAHNFSSDRPATELAHDWITEELRDLGWVD